MEKTFLLVGALSGAVSVLLGAFGAHALRERLTPPLLDTFETGVRYEIYHAGWAFVIGTLLFSGSLYLLALTGARWLGAVTPFGGIGFIAGWVLLAVGVWQSN
jgi:uncharacterized membrane protein YgdD (TMEM256/DUF423 family)